MFQHNPKQYVQRVFNSSKANKAMIMVHGRGGSADDILSLAQYFTKADEFVFVAPQADGNSWYPNSFLVPMQQNEPGLSNGLNCIHHLVQMARDEYGFSSNQIYFLGFSQGACLMLEYLGRHADNYGGVFAFSGALQGPIARDYSFSGEFNNMPLFLGCSDVDPHIPLEKVKQAATIFTKMKANVTLQIYPNAPHTILQQEIDAMNSLLK